MAGGLAAAALVAWVANGVGGGAGTAAEVTPATATTPPPGASFLRIRSEPGGAEVRTEPPGAHVTVAGTDAGVTPLELAGLERAEHHLTLAMDGHAPEERTVDLTEQASTELDVTLRSRQPAGLLDVSSTPWARVSVDGRVVAESTPVVGLRLSPGVHVVTLVNPRLGLRETRRVRIRDGRRSRIVTERR